MFGYVAGASEAADGRLAISFPSSVRLREPLAAEHVELGEGAAVLGVAFAERLSAPAGAPAPATTSPPSELEPQVAPVVTSSGSEATGLHLEITATEDDLFVLHQSLSKLRDLLAGGSMQLKLSVEAHAAAGTPLDRVRARNTVIEPLEERQRVDIRPQWREPGA